MKAKPRFSVVIPSYNNLELFKRALESVTTQTLSPFEIIVSDDSSLEDIQKFCQNLNNPIIRYIHNRPALGAVNNWNYGISIAKGDWIIVLHHDEEFGSNSNLEKISELTHDYDLIISDIRVRTASRIRKGRINGLLKTICLKLSPLNLIVNPIGPCACVAFHNSIKEFFDPKLTWLVDTEWYYRLLRKTNKLIFRKDILIYSNHGHEGQITTNINISEKKKGDVDWLKQKYGSSKLLRMCLFIKRILW